MVGSWCQLPDRLGSSKCPQGSDLTPRHLSHLGLSYPNPIRRSSPCSVTWQEAGLRLGGREEGSRASELADKGRVFSFSALPGFPLQEAWHLLR